eukprot:Phypoly_transcript_02177.p1 GENE.Phypoly_transcript_02177~~Phypoly_transcript_02177.p1  ORF type:complete len:653 (+),score=89.07 Phypoly_transcript_02177:845-2803(+)
MEGYAFSLEQRLKVELEAKVGNDPTILLRVPTIETYRHILHLLLFVEEVRMSLDIRQYDLHRQAAYKDMKGGRLFKLRVPKLAEKRPSVLRGDYVQVRQSDNPYCVHKGFVHFVNLEDILVSFHHSFNPHKLYDVQFSFTRTPLKQQHQALDNLNTEVWQRLNYGCKTSYDFGLKNITILGKVKLNAGQIDAVHFGMHQREQPLIIHGPPGTGKTATVVELILQLHNSRRGHILVCAPSNSAADLLAHNLSFRISPQEMLRLNAVQRSFKTLEPPSLLDYCFRSVDGTSNFELPKLHMLSAYRVIVCTCVSAGYIRGLGIDPGHFSHIIIDEAGEALETEALIPFQLATSMTSLVLAGDHLQLGPIVRSPTALEWRMDRSLMERMVVSAREQVHITKLTNSYRAHPMLLKLYSTLFYNNELIACADPTFVNSLTHWPPLPNKNVPMLFAHTEGIEDREKDSPSWFNEKEVNTVSNFVHLLLPYVEAKDIGIITPYRKQCDKFLRKFRDLYPKMKIGTVENFQGMERKVIIISLVRSKEDHLPDDAKFKLGFCANPKRLNVAISRAQALLIVVGNGNLFGKHDPHWRFLLQYCQEHNLFYGKPPVWETGESSMATNSNNSNLFHLLTNVNFGNKNNMESNEDVNVDQAWREDY